LKPKKNKFLVSNIIVNNSICKRKEFNDFRQDAGGR
jgi:hypothetical protein